MRVPALLIVAVTMALAAAAPAGAALKPGDLDTRFGSGGSVLLDPTLAAPRTSESRDVAIDAQGRVLVTGLGRDVGGKTAVFVQRLTADGAIDPSFAAGGVFIRQVGVGPTSADRPTSQGLSIVAAPDGGVLVGLQRSTAESDALVVSTLKLTAQGRLDLDYGTSGLATFAPAAGTFLTLRRGAMIVRPDGSVVLGVRETDSAGDRRVALVGFTATGQPGGVGAAGAAPGLSPSSDMGGQFPNVGAIASDGDAVLMVGTAEFGGIQEGDSPTTQGFLTRLSSPQFAPDAAFGGGDGVAYQAADVITDTRALAIGPGKVVYTGSTSRGASGALLTGQLTRYDASGVPDTSFGPGGRRSIQLSECAPGASQCGTFIEDLHVDSAGRVLVVAGETSDADRTDRIALLRYLPTGVVDRSFGADGVAYGPAATATGFVRAPFSVLQGTDRLVLGSNLRQFSGETWQAGALRFTLEPVADPPPVVVSGPSDPTPTPAPTPVQTPAPVPVQAPAQPQAPAPDRSAPTLSQLVVKTTKKRVGTLTFASSEAGSVKVELLREVAGRRSNGTCSAKAKRGAKCKVFAAYRTLKAPPALAAGANSVSLGSVLPTGRFQLKVTPKDAAGNTAASSVFTFTLKAAPKK